jgi:glutamate-ammonia-ligase adenylyltransferase
VLDSAPDTESALENLNYLKLASTLRIAVAQLGGAISGQTVQATLAALAAAILQGSLEMARRELVLRHGRIITAGNVSDHTVGDAGADAAGHADAAAVGDASNDLAADPADSDSLVVIAYGSLGSKEPGYESDLDLVFLFDGEDPASDGERSLVADRYYARLAQRMLGLLTAMTPSGKLYEVDTRLRPNGRAGSLVSSLAAFRDYQLQQAWTWELQALTRACPIAGHRGTGRRFNDIRRETLTRQREPATLAAELANMRARMTAEKGSRLAPGQQAKHAPGGLVDIEFVVQLGVLASAAAFPEVIDSPATAEQLQALARIGWMAPGDADQLALTAARLHEQRLLLALVPSDPLATVDTAESARICQHYLPPASAAPEAGAQN